MSNSSEATMFRILPPHVLLAACLSSWALDHWLPVTVLWGSTGRYIGGGIVATALAVNIYCALQFRRRQTTIVPFQKSTALLTSGLYGYSRNPIYLSMVVVLVGLAMFWGSLTPWLVPPLFMAIITVHFIRREEAMLTETFGDEYRNYCAHTRRWL